MEAAKSSSGCKMAVPLPFRNPMPYPRNREQLIIYGAPTLALPGLRICVAATTENVSELKRRGASRSGNAAAVWVVMFTVDHMDGV